MTYNRDMQEDKEPLFDAFHQTSGSLAMAKVVAESVVLNPANPAAAAEESWVVATDLAEELARSGVAFHRAHQIVGKLVLESVKSGKKPSEWNGAELAAFAPEFKPEMARLLNPVEGMKSRELPGGTARAPWRALWRKRPLVWKLSRPKPLIAMNKSFRQGQILQIVRSKEIYTQDELARELAERGVQTTQVTLSRDMREIGLVKTANGYRQLAAEKADRSLRAS